MKIEVVPFNEFCRQQGIKVPCMFASVIKGVKYWEGYVVTIDGMKNKEFWYQDTSVVRLAKLYKKNTCEMAYIMAGMWVKELEKCPVL